MALFDYTVVQEAHFENHDFWLLSSPLIILLIGFIINWYKEKKTLKSAVDSYKIWPIEWVDKSLPYIIDQIRFYNEFSEEIKSIQAINKMASLSISVINFKRVIEADLEKLTKVFSSNSITNNANPNKYLNQLLTNLELVIILQNMASKTYDEYCNYTRNLTNNWNKSFLEFNTLVNKHTIDIIKGKDLKLIEYNQGLHDLLKKWGEYESNTEVLSSDVIEPIFSFVTKESNNYIDNVFAFELRAFIHTYFRAYIKQWQHNKEINSVLINKKAMELESALKEIETSIKFLKTLETKPFWKLN